jgi:hypothetical protein
MIIPLRKVEVLVIHQRSHPGMQPVMSIQKGYSNKKFILATVRNGAGYDIPQRQL